MHSNVISKECYESGLRCRGICTLCKSRISCYQFNIENYREASPAAPFTKGISALATIIIGIDRIYDWISDCPNPHELKLLNEHILKCLEEFES